MIKAHPLVGVGLERVGPEFEHYVPADVPRPLPTGYYGHLHNIYYHFAAERGLPALAAILWLFGQALWDFARALRGSREATRGALGAARRGRGDYRLDAGRLF